MKGKLIAGGSLALFVLVSIIRGGSGESVPVQPVPSTVYVDGTPTAPMEITPPIQRAEHCLAVFQGRCTR